MGMSASIPFRTPTLSWALAGGCTLAAVGLAWMLGGHAAGQRMALPAKASAAGASAVAATIAPAGARLQLAEPPRIDWPSGEQAPGLLSDANNSANPQDRLRQAGGPPQASILRMWETTAKQPWRSTGPALTAKSWVITGMVQRGAQSQVIVLIDGQSEPSFFKVGDTLPGGARLVWIKPDTMGVSMPGGKRLEVAVFQQ